MRALPAWLVVMGALYLGGCSAPMRDDPARYDFGPDLAPGQDAPASTQSLAIVVSAPPWLDSTAMLYRLAYDNPERVQAYARSEWLAPPPMLLGQAIRERMFRLDVGAPKPAPSDGAANGAIDSQASAPILQIDLDDFTQIFDSAQQSHVLLRARARLLDGRKQGASLQQVFVISSPAPTPDALGAVHASRDAALQLSDALARWIQGAQASAPGGAQDTNSHANPQANR